ncbi:hypothetical protein DFH08DRAFT_974489 [Mycena albidolilacea]|uniref:Uncharacterized protein n=1 Tax=Mycena albidolilacea TaxID=1033008 RepID=A0AAD6Z6P9_9AGAR|nr:hypothetical protein DFH08DRAFT_974489 [Mycena albidolilacea]
MSTQPTPFAALLQGIANVAQSAEREAIPPPASQPLVDVSSSDLAPLVQLRREHQTQEERMGVQTYKNHKTGVEKSLTDRQILAQKMQGIVHRDQERRSSTGLNRTMRWTGTAGIAPPAAAKTGNAANAELAAGGRAKDAMKRRRTIFGKVKCIAWVAEAGIGSASQLVAGLYGFAMLGTEIFLARVVTMYSKNGGKAGAHAWVPTCDTIGTLSYMVVQVLRISHHSFLFLLPQGKDTEAVKVFRDHVEIGVMAQRVFDELRAEKEMLGKAVASLNTVRQKGKENVNILEMEEEEEEE